ncbi:MAG: sugar transferase [Ramlibacter sp.]|nr:sugar transferase [Ramlibacter sp.]
MKAKRLFDVAASLVGLVLLAPLLALVGLLVWLEAGSPVLFRQRRVGLHGAEFEMLKFRSMVVDAANPGPHHTADADPRITRMGRFIRRTSLDELPQLVNVLVGDMSLVGPRPDVPVQRSLYSEQEWAQRCSVRPGITGLAQASLRSKATFRQRLDLDLDYTRRAGLLLDLRILLMTLRRLGPAGSN